MGAESSCQPTKRSEPVTWSWNGPPGEHSPYPTDLLPYPGPDLLYCFIDIMTSFKILENKINLGPQVVTSNVEQFLSEFEMCYTENFRLVKFVKIPGVRSTMCNWLEKQPSQAIFCKAAKGMNDPRKCWKLLIEKRILNTKTLSIAEDGDERSLIDVIHNLASQGARLRCVNPVGHVRSQTTNEQYSVLGIDLFFEVPLHPKPVMYTYQAIRHPTHYETELDPTHTVQETGCDADWLGQLKEFLRQGWKLIDICIDSTALADAFLMSKAKKTVDAIWLFEKKTSKLHDHTVEYEGAIIEYKHKVKTGVDGDAEVPVRDWRPVVAGMGAAGWELATVLQTPSLVQASFHTYHMKMLFFFQRRVHPAHLARTRELHEIQQAKEGSTKRFRRELNNLMHKPPPQAYGTMGNRVIPRHIHSKPKERLYNPNSDMYVDGSPFLRLPSPCRPPTPVAAAAGAGTVPFLPNGDIPGRAFHSFLSDPRDLGQGNVIRHRQEEPIYEHIEDLPRFPTGDIG